MTADRFVSGESGALVNAINGRVPVPPGRKVRASERGVGGQPTLLPNAETYAQLAVLAMLGPAGYATAGTREEPGTTLLSVGGCAARPAVVEVPLNAPLGAVLDICAHPDGVFRFVSSALEVFTDDLAAHLLRAALPARPPALPPGPARARPARAEGPDSGREIEGLVVTEAWIAQLGGDR